jgi:hypothetical protein
MRCLVGLAAMTSVFQTDGVSSTLTRGSLGQASLPAFEARINEPGSRQGCPRSQVEVGWPNGRAPVLQTGRESSSLSPTTGDGRPRTDDRRPRTDDGRPRTDDGRPKTDDRRQAVSALGFGRRSSVLGRTRSSVHGRRSSVVLGHRSPVRFAGVAQWEERLSRKQ